MAGVKGHSRKRQYQSVVRDEAALETRRRIAHAAVTLFEANGYRDTSLSAVAAEACVARPTVTKAFGSKPGLLKAVVDVALAGDDEPVPVADRPWFRPVWDATSPVEILTAYAQVCTLIASRAGRIFEVVHQAADTSPDVAQLWATILHNRRAGAQMVITQLVSLGPVDGRPGDDAAIDQLWLFNDPAHFNALVTQCGWTESAFTRWLSLRMQDALLPLTSR